LAKIVLGLGTSHSPLLILGGDDWNLRAGDDRGGRVPLHTLDGRYVSYEELKSARGEPFGRCATPENFRRQAEGAERALDRLAQSLAAAGPDVVIIVGDDQGELYERDNIPAVAIFHGETLTMRPFEHLSINLPWANREFWKGYAMDLPHRFPGAPALASDIIRNLVDTGVDVAVANKISDATQRGFGHAIGFPIQRLFRGRTYPVIPILLNTYFPPNTPTPKRCHEIGRLLRQAIESSPQNLRVAVIASGGLSHFLCEEELDRGILKALRVHNGEWLSGIPATGLISGSSEIRNWILVGGAISHLTWRWDEYLPVHRTAVGSGVGLAFMEWN
jgi:hypothetical protein